MITKITPRLCSWSCQLTYAFSQWSTLAHICITCVIHMQFMCGAGGVLHMFSFTCIMCRTPVIHMFHTCNTGV